MAARPPLLVARGMLRMMQPYRRKLTREDAGTGTILIDKARWRLFPPPMQEFAVEVAGRRFATRIVAEDCSCVPPAHQHRHLEAGHFSHLLKFSPGAVIEFTQDGGTYAIRDG